MLGKKSYIKKVVGLWESINPSRQFLGFIGYILPD